MHVGRAPLAGNLSFPGYSHYNYPYTVLSTVGHPISSVLDQWMPLIILRPPLRPYRSYGDQLKVINPLVWVQS